MLKLVNELKNLLGEEIKRIPRPYGIFLSGGIDSGILAALSKPKFAITCNFPEGKKYDELKYAEKVAKYLGIPLTIVKPQKEDFKKDLHDALWQLKRPINSVSVVPCWNLMKMAEGKRMINGEGADELFGGYSRYLILNHLLKLYKIPELLGYHETIDFLLKGLHSRLVEKEMPETKNMEDIMKAEYEYGLPEVLYMQRTMATYFNVNFFQPFMSDKIRDFAWKLPMEYKIRGFTTKWILRQIARKYLPKEIAARKDKKGLICPVNKWMGWTGERGEHDKIKYVQYQQAILAKIYG